MGTMRIAAGARMLARRVCAARVRAAGARRRIRARQRGRRRAARDWLALVDKRRRRSELRSAARSDSARR